MLRHTVVALALTLAALAACDKPKEPEPAPKAAEAAKSLPSASASTPPTEPPKAAGELAWDAPASFATVPNASPMRKATYKIAKASGDTEDAELSVIVAGGGVEANVARWAGQFQEKPTPKRQDRKVGPLAVTIVELDGTFTGGGMPGMAPAAPKAKWKMLAAIVESGGEATFFKLTGPAATVAAARKDFDALVASLRLK
ncbi:MAG: hypothetical protein U0183_04055 [Polyangiaceae bacterium]